MSSPPHPEAVGCLVCSHLCHAPEQTTATQLTYQGWICLQCSSSIELATSWTQLAGISASAGVHRVGTFPLGRRVEPDPEGRGIEDRRALIVNKQSGRGRGWEDGVSSSSEGD